MRAGRVDQIYKVSLLRPRRWKECRNEPPGERVVHGKDEERFTVKLVVVQTPVSEEHHCWVACLWKRGSIFHVVILLLNFLSSRHGSAAKELTAENFTHDPHLQSLLMGGRQFGGSAHEARDPW